MNKLLNKLKAALIRAPDMPEPSSEARAIVEATCREAEGQPSRGSGRIKLSALPSWEALKDAEPDLQVEVAVLSGRHGLGVGDREGYSGFVLGHTQTAIASQLLRKDLPFREDDLAILVWQAARQQSHFQYGVPLGSILAAVERFCDGNPPPPRLDKALKVLLIRVDEAEAWWVTQATTKIRDRIEGIRTPGCRNQKIVMPKGRWGAAALEWIDGQNDSDRDAWTFLLNYAATSDAKSKPSQKWRDGAKPLIDAVGRTEVERQLRKWTWDFKPDPEQIDNSLDALKGLIWISADLDADMMAPALGRFAETCFKKIPQVGARSTKLGNACLFSLAAMAPNNLAIAELVRINTRVKYNSVRDRIAKYLANLAEAAGVTPADLEEAALPTFGLDNCGRDEVKFGDAVARLSIDDSGVALSWTGATGRPVKAAPASVRRDNGQALAELKQRVKDIDAARSTQIIRLEASWIEDRNWTLNVWKERYLDHPVRRALTRGLIWQLVAKDDAFTFMPSEDGFFLSSGEPVSLPLKGMIRLWHPLNSKAEEVLAWRARILEQEMTQPIKQAHREVYVVTDAERSTETYSNRFAAHILRQHQFRALCHARGWKYELQGAWDSWNLPTRTIQHHDLSIEFDVDQVEEEELSENGVALHIATDQVRFIRGDGTRVKPEDLAPVLFSELMRDVDLFVAVTSVANDPDWADGGPNGRYEVYWREHAFGDLSETAKTRRELVAQLVPKLTIADRLRVTDKYLEVRGNVNSYRIHLGSTNIMMVPENRYLCIVRGHQHRGTSKLQLPFTGDTHLSVILSKAFLLAADDKIKDKTILSQMRR